MQHIDTKSCRPNDRRRLSRLLAGLLMTVLFLSLGTGCGHTGRLDEGNCKLTVSFHNIPQEFFLLESNIKDQFNIRLTLKNIANEKQYNITLNEGNQFTKEVRLHPGIYQVYTLAADQASNAGISLSADAQSVRLSEDTPQTLHIYVDNTEEFTRHWMSMQPMPEIRLAGRFDGLVQVNRNIYDLNAPDNADLLAQFHLTCEKDKPIDPYKKTQATDSAAGVTFTLQNQTDQALDWRACKIVAIHVTKNNVVFPQGVTLGMAPDRVCHASDGLYGAPDAFRGSLLYGWDLDETYAIYKDPESGDRLTVEIAADGSSVRSINYELGLFE